MAHLKLDQEIFDSFRLRLMEKQPHCSPEDVRTLFELIKEEVLHPYIDRLINQVDAVLEINPSMDEREILRALARSVAESLKAAAVTIRVYDRQKKAMISFGSHPEAAEMIKEEIPFDDSIPGDVVKTHHARVVANLLTEGQYRNKEKAEELGVHAMLAIPFTLPRYSLKAPDTEGSLQIYYREEDRKFSPLEIQIAEVLSRRVSYVIARRRILDLQKINAVKDRIVEQIFLKLGRKEGIKMKDVFNLVIPGLADIMPIQRCSLFSVAENRQQVVLEAGYPEAEHGIGTVFSVAEPYIQAIVHLRGPGSDSENEKITPDYILIKAPQKSRLLPDHLKNFLAEQKIEWVLYVPLKVNAEVHYFLVFDAYAQHHLFNWEEIEIFTFFWEQF